MRKLKESQAIRLTTGWLYWLHGTNSTSSFGRDSKTWAMDEVVRHSRSMADLYRARQDSPTQRRSFEDSSAKMSVMTSWMRKTRCTDGYGEGREGTHSVVGITSVEAGLCVLESDISMKLCLAGRVFRRFGGSIVSRRDWRLQKIR